MPSSDVDVSLESPLPQYSWQEVASHNSEQSCWIHVDRKVYDITPWLDSHPGGKQVLLLAAGRDCTDLFVTYHPFTEKPRVVLKQYLIGELKGPSEMMEFPPDSGFYRECRLRVGDYFRKTGQHHKDPTAGLIRLACIFMVAFVSYWVAYSLSVPMWARITAAALFGACQALPLLHSMHDASHTSIGRSPWMWEFIGELTMDWFAGASIVSWHNQHVVGHHVYTNVFGADPDLPVKVQGDIRRVMTHQLWGGIYKLQIFYLPILYGLLAIKFRIQDVTDTLLARMNGPIRVNPIGAKVIVRQIVVKTLFVVWRILIPIYLWKVPVLELALLFLVSELMTGYWLTFNFQVSHISPEAIFPDIKASVHDEWAVNQMKTAVEYGHGSPIVTFLSGALNYQAVHHLFPSISQYYYPALAPIVREVAAKYNVPYIVVDGGFIDAFVLHLKHLQLMGGEAGFKNVH